MYYGLWTDNTDDLLSPIIVNTMAGGGAVLTSLISSLNVAGAVKFGLESFITLTTDAAFDVQQQNKLREQYEVFKEEYFKFKTSMLLGGNEHMTTNRLTLDGGHSVSGSSAILKGKTSSFESNFELGSEWGTWAKMDTGLQAESKSLLKASLSITQSAKNNL